MQIKSELALNIHFKFVYWICREFCRMVRKIYIYTKEEVQKMNSKSLKPRFDEPSSNAADGNSEGN